MTWPIAFTIVSLATLACATFSFHRFVHLAEANVRYYELETAFATLRREFADFKLAARSEM